MAKNITLLGASYTDVPAVELPQTGGGTATFTDVTDTTAVASDVAIGKYFFTASGTLTIGTSTGGDGGAAISIVDEPLAGGGVARHITGVDISSDTVTAGRLLAPYTAHDAEGNAVTGTIATRTSSDLTASGATVTAPAGYYASSVSKSVASGTAGTPTATKGTVSNHSVTVTPSVTNTTGYITGGTKTGTAVTVSASELVSGTKSITQNGTGIDVTNYASVDVDVPSGSATLITKTITANGTYNASSDSADGYSSVTVNVSGGGGASNVVTGTFIGTTAGEAMNVTIPYSGSGYPIAIVIEPTGGYRTSFVSTVARYATVHYFILKSYGLSGAPDYTGSYDTNNNYMATNVYKSSSSEPENISRNGNTGTNLANSSMNGSGSANGTLVYLHSATEMSVFIANTSYGFRANLEYTYRIIYSS